MFGGLLNNSSFDKILDSKGRGLQFRNCGSAKNQFETIKKSFGIESENVRVIEGPDGMTRKIFHSGKRTFTLRPDKSGTTIISVKTEDVEQQILIRFKDE